MKVGDTYIRASESQNNLQALKVISDDAYAICEYIEKLIGGIEHLRLSSIIK